ncbi:hypothetical protein D3P08_02295 [Paenibacillus nanensis]|uniref:Uncharacterized protein n=1 Tax=Paenibacillus nanensis TaxID=393251 RepID=A0A3A1VSD3_9BACL|nr:hypothetical protein [Paenibacillus nanensis]RIX60410.1 hypothetical protein D3P08_02295 [Paenibacillus nanensis]
MSSFEVEFKKFVEAQKKGAKGRRLEMLQKDMTGEKKLFRELIWPVFRSFEGFVMQYEMIGANGVTMYIDAFYVPLGIAFESEGFVAHAENITRDRFDFERFRIRTMANKGYIYFPYSWDELNKKPEACRSSLFELLGKLRGASEDLSLYERTVLQYASYINRPIRVSDVCVCLGKGEALSRKVLKELHSKKKLRPLRPDKLRNHAYVLENGL